ncbi:MAG TPA: SDR family oxidoreductase [Actinomycetales bacterium]
MPPTALVTGATAGIGLSFARRFAAEGYDLVLVARDAVRLGAVAQELRTAYGREVEVISADLADREQVQRVADRLADDQRPVDVLVNNAGFGLGHGFVSGEVHDEERMLDVLCRAVLVLSHAAARSMRRRRRGAIINVSSVSGFVAMGTYSAAKAWCTAFSEGLAGELAPDGVTVTALCPGFVRTEFHQRAGMNMSRLPALAWLDSDDLVHACLADVRRGKVVSVPSLPYSVLVAVVRHAPRALVRRGSHAVSRGRSGG